MLYFKGHVYIRLGDQGHIPAVPKMDATVEPAVGARAKLGAGHLIDTLRMVGSKALNPHSAPEAFKSGLRP